MKYVRIIGLVLAFKPFLFFKIASFYSLSGPWIAIFPSQVSRVLGYRQVYRLCQAESPESFSLNLSSVNWNLSACLALQYIITPFFFLKQCLLSSPRLSSIFLWWGCYLNHLPLLSLQLPPLHQSSPPLACVTHGCGLQLCISLRNTMDVHINAYVLHMDDSTHSN